MERMSNNCGKWEMANPKDETPTTPATRGMLRCLIIISQAKHAITSDFTQSEIIMMMAMLPLLISFYECRQWMKRAKELLRSLTMSTTLASYYSQSRRLSVVSSSSSISTNHWFPTRSGRKKETRKRWRRREAKKEIVYTVVNFRLRRAEK